MKINHFNSKMRVNVWGTLNLPDKDKILILAPDMSKNKAPTTVSLKGLPSGSNQFSLPQEFFANWFEANVLEANRFYHSVLDSII